MSGNVEIKASADGERLVWTDVTDPITGKPVVLYDPTYKVLEVKPDCAQITCADVPGFVGALGAVGTGEGLVFLSAEGRFEYRNGVGPRATAIVTYVPTLAPNAKLLGCGSGFRATQRELIMFGEQFPDALVPVADDVSIAWQKLAIVDVEGLVKVTAAAGTGKAQLNVLKDYGLDEAGIPDFWTAKSPYYDGGVEFSVVLRMETQVPEMDVETGKIRGELGFSFSLWSPHASEIKRQAMDDQREQMSLALPDGYTVVRGSLAV